MNAVKPIETAAQDIARRQQELREIIDEMLWGCSIYANTGRDYITITDDCGLEYSIRNVIARVKVARDVMAQLKGSTRLAEVPADG